MKKKHHPLLTRKSVIAALTLVVIIELLSILGALVLPGNFAAVLPGVVVALTNDARKDHNVALLAENETLTKAAQARAEDMVARGYFSHTSPDGKLPWYWFDKFGYKYVYAGENLAVNFTDSEELVRAWQNSPTHNLNMLGPRYREIGIGIATGMYQGREATFVVQFFASPAPQKGVLGISTKMPSPSLLQRIASSPRTYATYSLLTLALLFIAVLAIGWGKHHPKALAHGVLFAGLLAGIMYVNKALIYPKLVLPEAPLETSFAAI